MTEVILGLGVLLLAAYWLKPTKRTWIDDEDDMSD
jgi:hypothetical protein